MPPTRLASQSGTIGTCVSSRTSWRESSAISRDSTSFLPFAPGTSCGVLEEVVERAVRFEQLLGRLRADAGDARHVVDLVADERLEVDDLVGADAPVLAERGRVEHLVLADVVDGDAVGDELPAVLVARDDEAVGAGFVANPGERGQHVVGFVSSRR